MIRLQGLQKSYMKGDTPVPVLRGIDLDLSPGDAVTLMGESGAGKSTFLQLLGCLDTPTAGTFTFDGENVAELDETRLAHVRNTRIGFVFQNSYFVEYLDLVENVALPALYRGGIVDRDRERARELLTGVGLSHRLDHLPAALSGGERQRAALARALFIRPALILADEPTGNLDRSNAKTVLDMLFDLEGSDTTLVVVTHDPLVGALGTRQLNLIAGKLETRTDAVA